ncbi:hypothetical protein [Helicobacter bilis]|uniref:hypothetical protein n=1 Tax=Helicobacter bilis TaxID=37372 RepID=UPI000CF142EC|nr:hypothetical protein [Helicobacter bilis]
MTLIIENVKKEYVEAFQGLANGVKANMKTLLECNDNNATTQGINDEVSHIDKTNHINENLTENGYTDEFEKELLAELNDIKQQVIAGTLKTYNSAREMHDDILERNTLEKEVCNA